MKGIVKRMLPEGVRRGLRPLCEAVFGGYSQKSYSQEGEDLILGRLFEHQDKGFYVDVGAHHPKRFSNTYYFYKRGWKGINIDAMPGSMRLFGWFRPRDINIEAAISQVPGRLPYFIFNDPALSGFSERISRHRDGRNGYHIESTRYMDTVTLSEILGRYLPRETVIDFLSVDVEGLELEVLRSNNWGRYRPRVILVEILGETIDEILSGEIYRYLYGHGYRIFAKTVNTVIFLEEMFIQERFAR